VVEVDCGALFTLDEVCEALEDEGHILAVHDGAHGQPALLKKRRGNAKEVLSLLRDAQKVSGQGEHHQQLGRVVTLQHGPHIVIAFHFHLCCVKRVEQ